MHMYKERSQLLTKTWQYTFLFLLHKQTEIDVNAECAKNVLYWSPTKSPCEWRLQSMGTESSLRFWYLKVEVKMKNVCTIKNIYSDHNSNTSFFTHPTAMLNWNVAVKLLQRQTDSSGKHRNSFWWQSEITEWIPTKCMEVHFSQRLILGEWSWSLHRATEKVATVAVYTSKSGEKLYKKSPQPFCALNQWVQQKWRDRWVRVYSVEEVLL